MADEIRTEGGLIVDERVEEQVEPGDHERFAHYVKKEKIVESAVMGAPVVALADVAGTLAAPPPAVTPLPAMTTPSAPLPPANE